MNLIPRSAILCLCFSVGSLFAVAQGTCVFTRDPGKKTVKLTGDCGAIAGVKTQTGYTVDNSPEPATPSGPPKLEDMSAMPPTVDYQNGDLTIMAPNSTLSAILEAVRIKTGAEIEIPAGADSERVVGKIGPGAAREVLASLLNGSRFNYVMLGTETAPHSFAKLVLTPKAGTSGATETTAVAGVPGRGPAATGSGFAAGQPTASRVLLEQLRPRTLPYQPQAAQAQPEFSENTATGTVTPALAPVAASETEVPEPAAQTAGSNNLVAPPQTMGSNNSSVPEPVNTSDAQPVQQQGSTTPEQTTPIQVLQGMYGARRAMMEQQHKVQAPSVQEQ
ncbi:MAG: hypothetical protein DMG69_16720 [Acidobacteria bacterium]|nr:MAG: hypothetical protein DMG69_16720 [Acidobacteriota bacterium]